MEGVGLFSVHIAMKPFSAVVSDVCRLDTALPGLVKLFFPLVCFPLAGGDDFSFTLPDDLTSEKHEVYGFAFNAK